MKPIYNPIFLEHDTGMHPENRKRLEVLGTLDETAIEIGEEYLGLVHTDEYIKRVKEFCEQGRNLDPDTITSPGSYNAAVSAVGAAIMASQTNDFAVVRPPGHHAYPTRSTGFCLFNNIAIAVQNLVDQGKRVMVFDFDGHLGDGTFHTFSSTDKVLFWSLHQYPAFPGEGTPDQIGEGKGEGYSINVPLPPGSGDDIFIRAIERFITVAKQFDPDIVAVSAGFDAHQDDPLLDLRLSFNTYYFLGELLRREFTNVFSVLEGGYDLNSLPKCFYNFLSGINNKPQKFRETATESNERVINEYEHRTNQLEKNLSKFWKF